MKESSQFLRYLSPGLVFLFEFVVLWSLAQGFPETSAEATKGMSASLLLAAVLVFATGIGYLLSSFHHLLYWNIYPQFLILDYRPLLAAVRSNGRLVLLSSWEDEMDPWNLSRAGQWRVVTSIWKGRRENSQRIKGADDRTDSLADLMHGAGTVFVGAVSAAVAVALICYVFDNPIPRWGFWPGSLLLISFHLINFVGLVAHARAQGHEHRKALQQ